MFFNLSFHINIIIIKMLRKAIPVLPAVNISGTIDFFETKLGFESTNYGNYAILRYRNVEIHLSMNTAIRGDANAGCLIMVENIEDLYALYCTMDLVELPGKLVNKPWGNKEFTIHDNNHNLIRFGEKR
ncbi:MAG: ble [Ferruginibacter sp.]|nr:ble [Ferruginibacter sp.]